SSQEVRVSYDAAPTTAAAGLDQTVCGLVATLAGNTATTGAGLWSKVSGPGTVTFGDATVATTTATVSAPGIYVLRWTISNGSCPDSSDDVQVTYDAAPTTAAAGLDQTVCGLVATLAGNTPTTGAGLWSKVSGPGTVTFGDATVATTA